MHNMVSMLNENKDFLSKKKYENHIMRWYNIICMEVMYIYYL